MSLIIKKLILIFKEVSGKIIQKFQELHMKIKKNLQRMKTEFVIHFQKIIKMFLDYNFYKNNIDFNLQKKIWENYSKIQRKTFENNIELKKTDNRICNLFLKRNRDIFGL